MALLDRKFSEYKKQYLLQCLLAGVLMVGVLFALGSVLKMDLLGAIGASSLASSICLVMMAPKSIMSRNRNVLGGYAIGISVGVLCYFSGELLRLFWPQLSINDSVVVFGAIAVAVTQLLMVLVDVEHSPSAGLAIGLVVEHWEWRSMLVIGLCVLMLAVIHHLLRKRLMSLV